MLLWVVPSTPRKQPVFQVPVYLALCADEVGALDVGAAVAAVLSELLVPPPQAVKASAVHTLSRLDENTFEFMKCLFYEIVVTKCAIKCSIDANGFCANLCGSLGGAIDSN